MPQSLAQIWVHVVFSTKDRRPLLENPSFQEQLFRMLSYHVKDSKCISASIGGYRDHVHLLVGLSRTITIAELVEQVKTETSKWAKKVQGGDPRFAWQSGYGAFSVSHSLRNAVDKYIRNQVQHHARMSFKEEYRDFCEKHGIEIDERYVWD